MRALGAVILKAADRLSLQQIRQIFPIIRNSASQQISERLNNRLRTVQRILPLFAENGSRDPPVIMRIMCRKGTLSNPGITINNTDTFSLRIVQPAIHLFAQPSPLNMILLQKEHLPRCRKIESRKRFPNSCDLPFKFTIFTGLQHLDQQPDLSLKPRKKLRITYQSFIFAVRLLEILPFREIQPLPVQKSGRRCDILLKENCANITSTHADRDAKLIQTDPARLYSILTQHRKYPRAMLNTFKDLRAPVAAMGDIQFIEPDLMPARLQRIDNQAADQSLPVRIRNKESHRLLCRLRYN